MSNNLKNELSSESSDGLGSFQPDSTGATKSEPVKPEGSGDSSLVVGKRAFITALVAILLNPVSVIVGYLLTNALQRPKLRVEYIFKSFYAESALPPQTVTDPVVSNLRLNSQLHGELAAAARTDQTTPCTGWLDGESLGPDCLAAIQRAASGLTNTLVLERDAIKKNLERLKSGTLDKVGIQPMPLIRPELIAFGPDKLGPMLKGELDDCEVMLNTLRPFTEELRQSLASPARTGDVNLSIGVLNAGASDEIVKRFARLRFGNNRPLQILADSYKAVKAHSFEDITFTIGPDNNEAGVLDAWKKAIAVGESLPFEVELQTSTSTLSAKSNIVDQSDEMNAGVFSASQKPTK